MTLRCKDNVCARYRPALAAITPCVSVYQRTHTTHTLSLRSQGVAAARHAVRGANSPSNLLTSLPNELMQKYTPRAHLALAFARSPFCQRRRYYYYCDLYRARGCVCSKICADVNSLAHLQIVRAGAHPDLHYELVGAWVPPEILNDKDLAAEDTILSQSPNYASR